jgi:hypothetical protein
MVADLAVFRTDDLGGTLRVPGPFRETATGFFQWLSCGEWLAAESEALDDFQIALVGTLLDVIQEFTALGDQGEKPTAGRKVLFMNVQMIRKVKNPCGKQGHLIRGAAGVSFMELIGF